MKRKIIILLGALFLLTGCNVQYNLEIDGDNNYKEDFKVNAQVTSLSTMEDLYNSYLEEYPIYSDDYEEFMYYDPYTKNEDYTYYEKSYQRLDNGYIFNYKARFDYESFNRARTLNTVFNTGGVGYLKDEDYYYISVSNLKSLINSIDSVTVNITFKDVQVISNNATRVNGNTYTWKLDQNSTINVKYKLKNSTNPNNPEVPTPSENENNDENSIYDYILVIAVILLFIIAILGIIKYKSINNSN